MPLLTKSSTRVQRAVASMVLAGFIGIAIAMCVAPPDAYIQGTPEQAEAMAQLNSGDISFMLASTALVLIMTPGVAFFYGGMISGKNTISTIALAIAPLALIPVIWSFIGFSLAFGDSIGNTGVIGNPATYGLMYHVGAAPNPELAKTIPLSLYFMFQCVFAIVTPAIIIGSIADRVSFSALCIFLTLWHMAVYCPIAHMVWHPDGLIRRHGVLDFAGGAVVHMSSGYSSMIAAWYLGPSIRQSNDIPIESSGNKPLMIMGTALLWFGWMGFNGGSALTAGWSAAWAILNSNIAAACCMIGWMLMDAMLDRGVRATNLCMGAIVGLVAITPAAGYVNAGAAALTGIIASICCSLTQLFMEKFGRKHVDDTLDVFACHGMGGTVGMICTALFSSAAAGGTNGAFYGDPVALGKCLIVLIVLILWFCLFTWGCLGLTHLLIALRVPDMSEVEGLDALGNRHPSGGVVLSIAKLKKLHGAS